MLWLYVSELLWYVRDKQTIDKHIQLATLTQQVKFVPANLSYSFSHIAIKISIALLR